MRFRVFPAALVFAASSFVVPLVAHATIPFFGPVIPSAYNVCPASWGLLITVVNNIISLLITLAVVFVAPLMIAYAGFLFVVNPVNAGGKEKAREVLTNTIVGIVIALSGWVTVDAVMAVLYHPNDPGLAATTWSQLVTSGGVPPCIPLAGSLNQAANRPPATGISATGAFNAPPQGKAGTACDPTRVHSAALSGQPSYDLSTTQANILACIAYPESQCGETQSPPNYNWGSAQSSPGSTAAGAFQVLLSTNHSCYENTACYAAAGVKGPLNCQNAFDSSGNPKTDSASAALVQACLKAASSLNCSASAAACLLQKSGGDFSPWQADVNSATQTGCINSSG